MRYIYKHGNQYWYQRAIPEKLSVLLGKKTLKVSLKTNKISMAIKRAKLQALEHQRMFGDLKNNSTELILQSLCPISNCFSEFRDIFQKMENRTVAYFVAKFCMFYIERHFRTCHACKNTST